MKVNFKSLILLIVIIAGMILAVSVFSMKNEEKDAFLYNEVVDTFNKNSELIYTVHIDQYNVLHLGILQKDGLDENGNVEDAGETVELSITGTFDYEQAYKILELTNAERAKQGLSPISADASIRTTQRAKEIMEKNAEIERIRQEKMKERHLMIP